MCRSIFHSNARSDGEWDVDEVVEESSVTSAEELFSKRAAIRNRVQAESCGVDEEKMSRDGG